jgi:DHA1 family bicyclomycin/chloramphenicol resistance-like MFS transporter/DHA1 family 2-module integral membrane pump EmrD-like MFS transporter
MGITLCNFLSYGAYFSIFVVSPVLLIQIGGLSSTQFGLLTFIGSALAYFLAGTLNSRYVSRFGSHKMLRFGWFCMLLSGLLMLILPLFLGIKGVSIGVPMILCFFGSTFIWPNAFSIALNPFPHIAGYAGVSYRFMLLGGGAVIGSLISYLPHNSAIALALTLILCTSLAWIVYETSVHENPENKVG